jgi:hypothetical protein
VSGGVILYSDLFGECGAVHIFFIIIVLLRRVATSIEIVQTQKNMSYKVGIPNG